MTSIDMHLMGEAVHLHVTGPTTSSPVSSADLLHTVKAYIKEGRVLVRADHPALMTRFENAVYPPGTPANDDFSYYASTVPVPRTGDLGLFVIAIVRKTPGLRKYLSAMGDDRYRRLYEINLVAGGRVGHWAWSGSVEEAVDDVARDLQELWGLRKYRVTARS